MQTMQVQSTKDHSIFRTQNGNRQVNKLHKSRIKDSMATSTLVSPIIVNENYEIIDGQHRFEALKELDKPVQYIVVKGYGLKETQILNVNTKNWNLNSFLDSYCDLGNENYLAFKEFHEKYDFSITASLIIAGGVGNEITPVNMFRNGNLDFKDTRLAYERAEKITMLGEYNPKFHEVVFVRTMMGLFLNDNFEFSHLLSKLKIQPNALQPMRSRQQYLILIEDIYNYKSRNKVSLRY